MAAGGRTVKKPVAGAETIVLATARMRDRSAPFDVDVEDVEYARPGGVPLLARLYRPIGASGPRPALVDVHGGAWSFFDRTVDAYFDRALAASGVVVAALDFRQGSHRHPASVDDIVTGIGFVRGAAARLGVDPRRVGLVGGSSGGHLALLAGLRADADAACVLALWPIADPGSRYRYLLDRLAKPRPSRDPLFTPALLREGHESYFGDEATMDAASVPRIVAAGEAERLPPIWVAHPELDENVTLEMTHRLVDAYRAAGGSAELEVFAGAGHAFANLGGEAADRCIERMKDFLARALAGSFAG
jgi:acetyl esterase/lipase